MVLERALRSHSVTGPRARLFQAMKSKHYLSLISYNFPSKTGCLTKTIFQYVDFYLPVNLPDKCWSFTISKWAEIAKHLHTSRSVDKQMLK